MFTLESHENDEMLIISSFDMDACKENLRHSSSSWHGWTEAALDEDPAWLALGGCVINDAMDEWYKRPWVAVRVFVLKEAFWAFDVIQEHTHANVYKQIYDTVISTSSVLLLLNFCISQGSVVTHLRRDGKYDMSLVANLLLRPTVEEFLKSANISQSYERISSSTFLWLTV